ncbi:MAG TPA: glycosyltransferase family 39 protein [Planctomycetota bacterium]|nr:glycosyltransferase family 39 protein [Planctomycetota bacterium]
MIPSTRFSRLLGLVLIVDAAILLAILGRVTLSRIDETQIAEVSREMATGGDWVTPRIGGIPFPAYPPLQYWMLALSGSAFGFNEFAMRLPTALAALALIGVVALLTRRLAGDDAGLAAAMILGTTPSLFLQGTVCRADILTALCATAAFDRFLAWTASAEKGGRRNRDLVLMYLWTALGILAKGPLAIAVLGLGGLAWFLLNGQWKLLIGMKFWFGIPALLLIVVPWYYAVYRANGWAFLNENLFLENLSAYSDGYQQKRPFDFYFRQSPLLLPWLLVLPLSTLVRKSPGVALSLAWFGLIFLFLQISSAKRLNYLAYTTPALAIASATTLTALSGSNPRLLRRAMIGFGGLLVLLGTALALVPTSSWTGGSVSRIAPRLPWIGGVVAAAALGISLTTARMGICAGFAGMTGVLALAFFVYGFFVNPRLNQDNRDLAEQCRRIAGRFPEPIHVPAHGGAEGFYHFYMGRTLPSRDGDPGLYVAADFQVEEFRKAGKRLEVVDPILDQRGRGRYLVRIIP